MKAFKPNDMHLKGLVYLSVSIHLLLHYGNVEMTVRTILYIILSSGLIFFPYEKNELN